MLRRSIHRSEHAAAMQSSFNITLKNEKLRTYKVMGALLIIAQFVLAAWMAFVQKKPGYTAVFYGMLFFITATALYDRLKKNKQGNPISTHSFLLLIFAVLWASQLNFILFTFSLVMASLHAFSTKEKILTINNQGIRYPSFPVKKISWNELSNLVLKDGLLTIDFKNDKLIQQSVAETLGQPLDEAAFNEFCRSRIFANK
jgi:hypothetical protein